MNIQWTNIGGFGPRAWNHGGPPVEVMIRSPRKGPSANPRARIIDVSAGITVSEPHKDKAIHKE